MNPSRRHSCRGSVLSLMIIVSVVLTGLVMALAWTASTHANMAGQLPKVDGAFYAAEAGAQNAIWKFKHDNTWRAPAATPLTGSIAMYNTTWNYSVTCLDNIGSATLAWKFDEDTGTSTADSTGLGNTGVFHGGVTWDPNGRSGSCIDLNGIDAYVDCGNNSSTNLTSDMTFSSWVRMNSGYYDQKIGGNQNGQFGGYKLCIYNSKAEFEVRDASNNPHLDRDVAGGTILTMGSWYHIVGEYSASGHWIKTYVNGKLDRTLVGDGTGTGHNDVPIGALGTTTGNFVMGKEPWDTLYYFNGSMDDIRVFNRTLSDLEVKALYDTTVDIVAKASGAGTNLANYTTLSASIPTPPAPTIPAITTIKPYIANNVTITGDLDSRGAVSGAGSASTINGNVVYGDTYSSNNLITITSPGVATPSAPTAIAMPNIDYTYLHNQASSYGQVVAGSSTNQNFTFNNLGGNKVIWIQGDLVDPTVTIGGTYAAGGTFVVDGAVKFTTSATIGASGYPVYFVTSSQAITHSGGTVSLVGGIYSASDFNHQNFSITGPVVVNGTITNSATGPCTFAASGIPWFDNRVIAQNSATLPLYTTNHMGFGQ